MRNRFSIVNVRHPLDAVKSPPLAPCDARPIAPRRSGGERSRPSRQGRRHLFGNPRESRAQVVPLPEAA
ncbi:putative methyltransferase CmcJ [Burkholderia thailandensis]|uniref:Methyltransferase CmcJ n=1 Tax=Burkholderia thailandensis TaxID=57975 RepID=A0AAW9CUE6_BURTH|nr:putative methyltransferase CmcJ [Burkholderia thailandensis]MDW9252718.1 putative methyltransferase CmcJ [Burkholderia thailandensis]